MTDCTPPAEAVEAACRAVHPTRWEHRAIAHPCEECATAVTAAGPIVAAEVAAALKAAAAKDVGWPADPEQIALTYRRAARIARGEGS